MKRRAASVRGIAESPRWAHGLVLAVALLLPGKLLADWRQEVGTFRIGVVAEPSAGNAIAGLAELKEAYARVLGVKVEFLVARDYEALIEAQVRSGIHYAILSATAFAVASLRCGCVEPLVAPVGEGGVKGIRSVLIARAGTLVSTADMERWRVAILPPDNMAGHQLPLALLGLPNGRLTGSEPFLVHAQSAASAEAMLAEGKVDALFGWVPAGSPDSPEAGGTLARLQAAGLDGTELVIVWRSGVLAFGPHTIRSDLDPEPKRLLAAFLAGLRESAPELYEKLEHHHLGGFARASEADYAAALAVVRRLTSRGRK